MRGSIGARRIVGVIGALSAAAGIPALGQSGRPAPVSTEGMDVISIEPLAIAPAAMGPNGPVITGDWVEYSGNHTRASTVHCAFDTAEVDWATGGVNWIGGNLAPCSLPGPAVRYYFGPGYHCPHYVEDMDAYAGAGEKLDLITSAFTWESTGDLTMFYMFDGHAMDTSCTDSPDNYGFSGFALSFGVLPGSPSTIYSFTATGLNTMPGTFTFPPAGDSSKYRVMMMEWDPVLQTYGLAPGPCQSLLWATGDALNLGAGAPLHTNCGDQRDIAWDDDNPTDGNINAPDECYSYQFGMCADPLAHANAFGYRNRGGCPTGFLTQYRYYKVTGAANNKPWSWRLTNSSFDAVQPLVPGVASGGPCSVILQFASSIGAYSSANGCGSSKLNASLWYCDPFGTFGIMRIGTAGAGAALYVGPVGTPNCKVSTNPWAQCSFNPDIYEIALSEQDCNHNDQDDALDIATGSSADLNGNGVPDECEMCAADFDHDGFVSGDDFDGFVAAFELGDSSSDFNGDGFVNGDDFDWFVVAFEQGC